MIDTRTTATTADSASAAEAQSVKHEKRPKRKNRYVHCKFCGKGMGRQNLKRHAASTHGAKYGDMSIAWLSLVGWAESPCWASTREPYDINQKQRPDEPPEGTDIFHPTAVRCLHMLMDGYHIPWKDQKYGQIAYLFHYAHIGQPSLTKHLTYVQACKKYDYQLRDQAANEQFIRSILADEPVVSKQTPETPETPKTSRTIATQTILNGQDYEADKAYVEAAITFFNKHAGTSFEDHLRVQICKQANFCSVCDCNRCYSQRQRLNRVSVKEITDARTQYDQVYCNCDSDGVYYHEVKFGK